MKPCASCGINPRVIHAGNKSQACYCKECWAKRAKEWNAKNRDRVRHNELRRKFGISKNDYDRMHEVQEGLCAICKRPETTGRALAVDHNHATGTVRALLCVRCNNGIGQLQENPAILYRAIEYLNKHS